MSITLKEALWDVSRKLPVFEKDSTGFKFKYVNLETIVEALVPLLEKSGLAYRHGTFILEGRNVVQTTIYFKAEPKTILSCELVVPDGVQLGGMNGYQSLGSALTYFRRYNLVTMFDIVGADEDVDATNSSKKVAKIDYIKKLKGFIASGKHPKANLEKWFNKERGTMDDAQRSEAHALIANLKK